MEGVEGLIDELAHRRTQELLPRGGRAGSAGVEDELATAAQHLDVMAYPAEHMATEEQFEGHMQELAPHGVQRELYALQAEAQQLGGEGAVARGGDAEAEENGQGGDAEAQAGEQAQEEAEEVHNADAKSGETARLEGAAVRRGEQQPEEQQKMEAVAAPEAKQEPDQPSDPTAQGEATPEQGLKPGVAAGQGQAPPAVSEPEGSAAAVEQEPGLQGKGEQQEQEQMRDHVRRIAEVAAPDAQLAPDDASHAATAAPTATRARVGRKRKAPESVAPAEPQQQQGTGEAGSTQSSQPSRGSKRSKKGKEVGAGSYAVFLEAVQAIPAGQTATYSEVATTAGKGPGSSRMVGKALRQLDPRHTDLPWWRVVGADGSLHPGSRQLAALQLQKLRQEGARPKEGQSVADWCREAGCPLVGCYEHGAQRRIYTKANDPAAANFSPAKVEKLASEEQARHRGFVRMATLVVEE